MNRRICEHDWIDVLEHLGITNALGFGVWFCQECGTLKLDILGTIKYWYCKRERPNIYESTRRNGKRARRNNKETK